MNEPEPHPHPSSHPESGAGSATLTGLQREIGFLRTLLVVSLLALNLLTISFAYHVFRQLSAVRRELDASNALLQEYQVKREPLVNSFISGLQDFSRNHPDLVPLLERYSISPVAALPSGASPSPAKPAQ